MSLETNGPSAMSAVIDPAHAWILGLVPVPRSRPAVAPVAPVASAVRVEIRDDCACPDACARDHDNE